MINKGIAVVLSGLVGPGIAIGVRFLLLPRAAAGYGVAITSAAAVEPLCWQVPR